MTITKVRKADDDVKTYKLSEVALRNGSDLDEVWIIYKDTVYDVTKYMDKHPGGPELVMEYAGKDCTKGFNDAGHSLDAMKDLKKLKIGEIVEVILTFLEASSFLIWKYLSRMIVRQIAGSLKCSRMEKKKRRSEWEDFCSVKRAEDV